MEDITLAYLDAQRCPQIWSFADVDFWVGYFLFFYCQFRYTSLISFVHVKVRSCYLFTIHFQIVVCWRFHFQMKWKEQNDRLIIWVIFTEAKVSWFGPMIVRPLFICNNGKYDSIKVINGVFPSMMFIFSLISTMRKREKWMTEIFPYYLLKAK